MAAVSNFRFGLSDIFWIMPLAAAIAYCYKQLGPSYTLATAIAASIALFLLNGLVRHESYRVYVWMGLPTLFLFCTIPIFQIVWLFLTMMALCLAIRLMISHGYIFSPKWVFRSSVIVATLTLFFACNVSNPRLATYLQLREENPVVSLEERLGFETNRTVFEKDPEFSDAVQSNLESTELLIASRRNQFWNRSRMLQLVHDKQTEQFLRANGFGVGRMGFARVPRESIVRWQASDDIQFDDEFESQNELYGLIENQEILSYFSDQNEAVHFLNWFNFLEPSSFGWSKQFQKSAGFVPHAFYKPASTVEFQGETKSLVSLQLISLHRFDKPKAYVLDHLPRMEQLSGDKVKTRALNEFENVALSKLAYESDLEITEKNEHLLMLGSIRANKSCLQCHAVESGELLGAFTYQFK